jgi:Flp pilus assembly protein TadG
MRLAFLRQIIGDRRGSMAIETAIVAPTLILMTLGTFEVGRMVARQHELQSAANESEIIAIATNGGAETDIDQLEEIIRESVGLDDSGVTIERTYRCNADETLVDSPDDCFDDDVVSSYLVVDITETYTPTWNILGIGEPLNFEVRRTVQIS